MWLQALRGVDESSQPDVQTLAPMLAQVGESNVEGLRRSLERQLASAEEAEQSSKHKVGTSMIVSLDHSIYFHNPRAFRVDEWMFNEMESPWAGRERGLVYQKLWAEDGTLIATCVQEVRVPFLFFPEAKKKKKKPCAWTKANLPFFVLQGLVRLEQDDPPSSKI